MDGIEEVTFGYHNVKAATLIREGTGQIVKPDHIVVVNDVAHWFDSDEVDKVVRSLSGDGPNPQNILKS